MNAYHFMNCSPDLAGILFVVNDNTLDDAYGRLLKDDLIWRDWPNLYFEHMTYASDTISEKWGFETIRTEKNKSWQKYLTNGAKLMQPRHP